MVWEILQIYKMLKDCCNFMRLFNAFIFAFSLSLCGFSTAQAQISGAAIANFMPKGAWNVQPALGGQTSPSLNGVKMPCMMMTEYDNGYVLRLSGGGGKFLAMALDVRQRAFTQGRKYNANLSLNNGFNKNIQATAFSESVLIFNVRPIAGLYGALANASNMTLNIEGNGFGFGLGSLQSAVNGLESCYGGAPMNAPMNLPANAPVISANMATTMPNIMPPAAPMTGAVPMPAPVGAPPNVSTPNRPQWGRNISKSSSLPAQKRPALRFSSFRRGSKPAVNAMDGPVPSPINNPVANPIARSVASPMAAPNVQAGGIAKMGARSSQPTSQRSNWNAKAGDDIRATLERWASRAGVKLDWQAGMGGKVAQNFNISSSFGEAVQALMAQNAAATGLNATMRGAPSASMGAPSMPTNAPTPIMPISSPSNVMAQPSMGVTAPAKWHAATGTSLEQALDNWARKEGVELVWQANTGFGIKRTVHSNGAFTDALQEILSQYQNDNIRPLAQLNNDPVTGKRTLFVQSTRI